MDPDDIDQYPDEMLVAEFITDYLDTEGFDETYNRLDSKIMAAVRRLRKAPPTERQAFADLLLSKLEDELLVASLNTQDEDHPASPDIYLEE